MALALVQRVDVDLAGIKRQHVGEKALDPREIGRIFLGLIPEPQNLEVKRVAAQSKGDCIGGDAGNRAMAVLHDHGRRGDGVVLNPSTRLSIAASGKAAMKLQRMAQRRPAGRAASKRDWNST